MDNISTVADALRDQSGLEVDGGVRWQSMPDHPKMQQMAQQLVGATVILMRREIECMPPETRNRLTQFILFGEEKWTLTLAKGAYESVMEAQRDAARTERDYWMNRALNNGESK
jgi:hypothetical protein